MTGHPSSPSFRALDALEREFDRVTRERPRPARKWWAGVVVAGAIALAATPVGAAVSDVAGNFADYIRGDESGGPGLPVDTSEIPDGWLQSGDGNPRLLARDGNYELLVARNDQTNVITFSFNGASWAGGEPFWQRFLADKPVVLLAFPETRDAMARGERPMFGLTARDITKVTAQYVGGGNVSADTTNGGFVLILDPKRQVSELDAYDAEGNLKAKADPAEYFRGSPG